jgi:hypothetical protein
MVYILTHDLYLDTWFTSWHTLFNLIHGLHRDTWFTTWHMVYNLTHGVNLDTLFTSWHMVYNLTHRVHLDTWFTSWHTLFNLIHCLKLDTRFTSWNMSTNWHIVYLPDMDCFFSCVFYVLHCSLTFHYSVLLRTKTNTMRWVISIYLLICVSYMFRQPCAIFREPPCPCKLHET